MISSDLDPAVIGKVISRIRFEHGLTQEVLSGLAGIGRSHLSAIERGQRKPTLETFYRICCSLDVPMSAVVKEIEDLMKKNDGR